MQKKKAFTLLKNQISLINQLIINNYYDILGINRNATDEQIKRAYRRLALIYHPDRNTSSDAHEVFMIINQAYEILSNYKARAEHDFMIDYQNVINISNEININSNSIKAQKNHSNQRNDKKYYRTNNGYTPPINPPLNYKDKPLWTKIGISIFLFGIIISVFTIVASLNTAPKRSKYISYNSKYGTVKTDNDIFFGMINENQTAIIFLLERSNKDIYIIQNKSKIANFSMSATIENIDSQFMTIGRFAIAFSIVAFILSISSTFLLKKNYYLFIKVSSLNMICQLTLLMMIT